MKNDNKEQIINEALTKCRVDQYGKVYDEHGIYCCKWDSLTESEQALIKQNPASAL